MKKYLWICLSVITYNLSAQHNQINKQPKKNKPTILIGIVVDQMCWEYLSKFRPYFSKNGGFNRLLNNGANCVNTHIPYLPTITACGHTCVYTGSVPAFHGIAGNVFWDNINQKQVYCTEDNSVKSVGGITDKNGKMSPKNLWASTIADQLRLFYNFKNKSFGISIKDRGAILPAGQSANAAYWYDPQSGNFITSTYYQNQLPNWLIQFNNQKKVNEYYKKNWQLSLPIQVYQQQCDDDNNVYENNPFNSKSNPVFPYILDTFVDKDFTKISSTPFANDLLVDLAQKLIIEEKLGKNNETDFLSISFSSPDYIGHSFGPNSFEQLDDYVKLDLTLERLCAFLDNQIGVNNYTLFLTADHAVSPIPAYLNKHHIKANIMDDNVIKKIIFNVLDKEKIDHNIISAVIENDIYFNDSNILNNNLSKQKIISLIQNELLKNEDVLMVVNKKKMDENMIPTELKNMIINGYNAQRSGELLVIFKPFVVNGYPKGTSHSVWYNYDKHIPLIFYGNGVKKSTIRKKVFMTDIAATISNILQIQEPNASIGNCIEEVLQNKE